MEVASLLTEEPSPYPRQSDSSHRMRNNGVSRTTQNSAPTNNLPKKVAFELLLDEGSRRARIPMRVLINTHDTSESIVTTVKNFYGIYEGHGVSFEDEKGRTLMANYENFSNDMLVYVRTVADPQPPPIHAYQLPQGLEAHRKPSLGEPFHMLPPQPTDHSHSPSRPTSRLARKRSLSPQFGRGRRSASQQKSGAVSNTASRGSSAHGSHREDGYSDSDGGQSSLAGSKKARSEQFASAEISLENVLQDGRRKGPSFESSELPLFVPPQVPLTTSISSISPQRRSIPQEGPSPFARPVQKLWPYPPQLLPSPQHSGYSESPYNFASAYTAPNTAPSMPQHGHRLRDRSQAQGDPQSRRAGYTGHGVLPTPDPTVASCISDEDVARQLIALGDASNFSQGRTSASTLEDAFSGAADAASSTGATSDSEDYSEDDPGLPDHKRAREYGREEADDEYDHDALVKSEYDDYDGPPKTKKIKTKAFDGAASRRPLKPSSSTKGNKLSKGRANTLPKASKASTNTGLMKAPTAPTGNPAQPRKTSSSSSTINFQHQLGADEEDLSTKPRCQRCRKSKKGCDRQRPCQRCKDAGIGIEGCISEDEGNGRKGRYGRHMGVAVKKDDIVGEEGYQAASDTMSGMAGIEASSDKNKKRKR